jgi:hypothetical protein
VSEYVAYLLKALLTFALLGVPSIAALLYWKRRGVGSKSLYRACWAQPASYLLWFTAVIITNSLIKIPAFYSKIGYSIPVYLLVFWPMLSVLVSFVLCALSLGTKPGERGYVVLANGLMLALWATTIVAPN